VGPTQYAPPPASGVLNSHPLLSYWYLLLTSRPLDIDVPVKHTSCSAPKFPRKVLTFRPLNGITSHRVMGFLRANFQLPMPYRSRFKGCGRGIRTRADSSINLTALYSSYMSLHTYHFYDLLQHEAELYMSGFREIDDRMTESVVSSCVEQLCEQRIFVWVSLHHYTQRLSVRRQ